VVVTNTTVFRYFLDGHLIMSIFQQQPQLLNVTTTHTKGVPISFLCAKPVSVRAKIRKISAFLSTQKSKNQNKIGIAVQAKIRTMCTMLPKQNIYNMHNAVKSKISTISVLEGTFWCILLP
jgi:hypothetical protein